MALSKSSCHWQKCLATDAQCRGAIDRMIDDDELIDDLTVVDPYEVHAPSRRSDKDLDRLLGKGKGNQ